MGTPTGDRDRRIRIERAAKGDDGYNTVDVWVELATRWTRYVPAKGREAREALGREATATASFVILWSSILRDVGPNDRLRYPAPDGPVYDIKSVVELGRRTEIEIVAMRGDDAA